MNTLSFKQAALYLTSQLSHLYPASETTQFARLFFEHHLGFKSIDFITRQHELVDEKYLELFNTTVARLQQGEPIQHIIGKTWFGNLIFNVNSSVLIPRPETEELVDWVVKDNRNQPKTILDIGTGSGCIAISLKNELPQSTVVGWDVSDAALDMARANALLNNLEVAFERCDILSFNANQLAHQFDVIVSNPPYIKMDEKPLMHINVLNHEPHLALFVTNDDPLLFYRAIAEKALMMLTSNGKLYFEINEAMGNETVALLSSLGFVNIELRKDLNNKHRMIKATLPH